MRKVFGLMLGTLSVFLAFSVLHVVPVSAADEIYVTSVEKSPVEDGGAVKELATIVLNDCIKVKEIQVIKAGGRATLKYPVYVSKRGKEYPQFEVLTKQATDEIEKAVSSGKPSSKQVKAISYKISNFSPLRGQSARKVNVNIDFNNAVRVFCGVMESKKGPWISWPSAKNESTGKYVKQVLVTNKKLQDAVEKALLEKYSAGSKESSEE